ncbi:MAG: hypothetical protein PHW73_04640, partial [Atribacterota bacterium]|nr:hypothetical protein [Atribacterota bacterium]
MKRVCIILFFASFALTWLSSAQSQEDSNKNFGNLLAYYYLNPAPDKVPEALENFISSEFFKSGKALQNNSDYIAAYSFGRIAQLNQSLITQYEDLFNTTTHEGRLFILKIFQVCGNEQIKVFLNAKLKDKNFIKEKNEISQVIEKGIPIKYNPLEKEVQDASELDFLWAEFMITGNARVVQKIIDILEWPDHTRNKLNDYLKEVNLEKEKEGLVDLLASDYKIVCNMSNQEVVTQDDLDIMIAASLQQQRIKSESFQKVKNALNLTKEDILYMATKGIANWSLTSNAQQHKKVFEICDAEISKRSGSVKIGLLRIAAYCYVLDNNIEEATSRLKQLVSLDPANVLAHFSLGAIYLKNKDIKNAIVEKDILQ